MNGHIRKRGKNSWAVVLPMGRDEQGRPRYKWHTVRGTRRDAERERARLVHALNTGDYVEPTRLTLAEYLERWLETARGNLRPRTFERYESIVRQQLKPALGTLTLAKLHPAQIQSYYDSVRDRFAQNTLVQYHAVLHRALRQAVKLQLIARNPADAVEAPRRVRREMQTLTADDCKRLCEAARGTRLFVPVLLGVMTGMRRGEILGLKWGDIDLEHGTIAIRRALSASKRGLEFTLPKTARGRRTISVGPYVLRELKRHRTEQGRHRLLLGLAYNDQDLVCARPDGRPWNPNSFSPRYARFFKKLGLPTQVSFHGLRHSHATLLLQENVHAKITSERLGHANIGITLDTYSHVIPGMQDEAARKIDEALGSGE